MQYTISFKNPNPINRFITPPDRFITRTHPATFDTNTTPPRSQTISTYVYQTLLKTVLLNQPNIQNFRTSDRPIIPQKFSIFPQQSFYIDPYFYPSLRKISKTYQTLLSAPNLPNDLSTQPLAWSSTNTTLASVLGPKVYLYTVENDSHTSLDKTINQNGLPTAIYWLKENQLVVGNSRGQISITDLDQITSSNISNIPSKDKITTLKSSTPNTIVFSSQGDKKSNIGMLDVKSTVSKYLPVPNPINVLDTKDNVLASGERNAPIVSLWDIRRQSLPFRTLNTTHKKGVQTLNWCPWNNQLLAIGGDNTIEIWDTTREEKPLASIKTDSKVYKVMWTNQAAELISTHKNGKIVIWKYNPHTIYPPLKVTSLTSSTSPLPFATYNGNNLLATGAPDDETITLWNLNYKKRKREEHSVSNFFTSKFSKRPCIR